MIRVFIAKDEKSAALLKLLEYIIEKIPPAKRPRVKIHVAKIDDVSKFPSFLAYLEEIYGGVYTLEYRKYKVEKLPTIIIDDKKVLEGHFPTEDELIALLSSEGIEVPIPAPAPVPQPLPPSQQPLPQQPIPSYPPGVIREPTIQSMRPITHPSAYPSTQPAQPTYSQTPHEQPTPPNTMASKPVEQQEDRYAQTSEVKAQPPRIEAQLPQPTAEPTLPNLPEIITPEEEAVVQPSVDDLRGTCYDCIYFDPNRSWCLLHRIRITDPLKPICGRRKR